MPIADPDRAPIRARSARCTVRGSILVIALLILVLVGAIAVGAVSLVGSGTSASADRVQSEQALFAAESGIRRIRGSDGTCDDYAVGTNPGLLANGARFSCESSGCGDRDLVRGEAAGSMITHALCADLDVTGPLVPPGGAPLAPTSSLSNGGSLANRHVETPGAASLSSNGNSHSVDQLLVEAGGSVSLSLGNSASLTRSRIEAGGAVSVSVGGQGALIDRVVIEAEGSVSVDVGNGSTVRCLLILSPNVSVSAGGNTTATLGQDYFVDAASAEQAGCDLGAGDGSLQWSFAS